jgi:hypothetical protein
MKLHNFITLKTNLDIDWFNFQVYQVRFLAVMLATECQYKKGYKLYWKRADIKDISSALYEWLQLFEALIKITLRDKHR